MQPLKKYKNNLNFVPGDLICAEEEIRVLSFGNNESPVKVILVAKGEHLVYLKNEMELAPKVFAVYLDSLNLVHYFLYRKEIVRVFDQTIHKYFLRDNLVKIVT